MWQTERLLIKIELDNIHHVRAFVPVGEDRDSEPICRGTGNDGQPTFPAPVVLDDL